MTKLKSLRNGQYRPFDWRVDGLTRSQWQIVCMIAEGKDYQEIADATGSTWEAVKTKAGALKERLHMQYLSRQVLPLFCERLKGCIAS